MYPAVTVKGSTGLLVILLVFSEVHSFIFEDEGGTDFCSRIDLHQNESTRKWLQSSCNVGMKKELGDLMLPVRYNKIPRVDFSRTHMLMKDRRVTQERQQKFEAYRTSLSRGGNDITRNLIRNDNKRVREEKYPIRESARLNERSSSRLDNIRTERSLDNSEIRSRRSDIPATKGNLSTRSSGSADANEIRRTRMSGTNRRFDNRALRMSENRLARSNDIGITSSLENQAIRSTADDTRVLRSSENRFMESNVIRHVRSASYDAFRSLDGRRTGNRAVRSVETRATGGERSIRSDDLRTIRALENRESRANEIRSTRSRENRMANRYTSTDSNEGTRFRDNRIDKSDENRVAISVDMQNIRLSGSRSTRSPKIRTTRSLNNAVVESEENIRISRSASRLPVNDFDDNPNIRSAENQRTMLNSRSTRTTRRDGSRATKVFAVSSLQMSRLARSPAYRDNEMDENRITRSIESRNSIISNGRSIRSVNIRSDDLRTIRALENKEARLNEIRSTRSRENRMDNRYTSTDSNEGTRFRDNRIAKSDENRVAIFADMRNIRLSGRRSTKSPKIRTTRSLNDAVEKSEENIRISRSASRLPVNDFDDNRNIRSAENRRTMLNSRSTRTTRRDGSRATKVFAVSSPQMTRLARSPAHRDIELDENRMSSSVENRSSTRSNGRSTRSVNVRTTRSVERSSTRSKDIESWLMNEFSVRSNAKLSDVSVNSRSIRLNDHSIIKEDRRNMDYRTGGTLQEKIRESMAAKSDKMILAESDRKILNDKTRAMNHRQSARFNTRRSSVVRENSRREPLRLAHDIGSRRDNFFNAETERRNKPNEREEYSRFDISSRRNDYRDRSLSRERSVRKSVKDVRNTRGPQRESARIDDVSNSRNYKESRRSDVGERRSFIFLGEEESRRLSHEMRQVPVAAMEKSQEHERNSRSMVRSRLVGETRKNSLFARIGTSRFERIREFGNDKRQRQIMSNRNIDQNRRTRDRRETFVMSNLRNTFVQRRLSISPSRFQNNNDIRTKYERIRDIMRDMETRSALSTQQVFRLGENKMETSVPILSLRKIGSGHRQYDQRMVERNSIDNRVWTRKNNEDESTNSHRTRLEYRRKVFGISEMPRLAATDTRNGIRSIENARERRGQDGNRMVRKLAVISGRREYSKMDHQNLNMEILAHKSDTQNINYRFINEKEPFMDLGRKTENYRSRRTHDNFRKMEVEKDNSFREGLFGISTNTALQVTLASILVGQLIFSRLGSSKGSYCTVNLMRGLKSF